MLTMAERICNLLESNQGLTDREITDSLNGPAASLQPVNTVCRTLTSRGVLIRRHRKDGQMGNYLISEKNTPVVMPRSEIGKNFTNDHLSEDDIKNFLEKWLKDRGWQVATIHDIGSHIEAHKGTMKWIIEVKGSGSAEHMQGNYFLEAVGALLLHMDNPETFYSIAFPDLQQFRGMWERFPGLAKKRTQLSVLFIDVKGKVAQR